MKIVQLQYYYYYYLNKCELLLEKCERAGVDCWWRTERQTSPDSRLDIHVDVTRISVQQIVSVEHKSQQQHQLIGFLRTHETQRTFPTPDVRFLSRISFRITIFFPFILHDDDTFSLLCVALRNIQIKCCCYFYFYCRRYIFNWDQFNLALVHKKTCSIQSIDIQSLIIL